MFVLLFRRQQQSTLVITNGEYKNVEIHFQNWKMQFTLQFMKFTNVILMTRYVTVQEEVLQGISIFVFSLQSTNTIFLFVPGGSHKIQLKLIISTSKITFLFESVILWLWVLVCSYKNKQHFEIHHLTDNNRSTQQHQVCVH